jgi:G:T-mismatch repair DNA endonuclease (very short patch repair protein)
MGQLLEIFNKSKLNDDILNLHSNNHTRRKYIRSILTKDFLEELVIKENHSIYHICTNIFQPKNIKTDASHIFSLCKEYNIPTLRLKERAALSSTKEKRKMTTLKKYGVNHVMVKNSTWYKKRNRTVKKKYGVKNVFQLDEIKKISKNTMVRKYGVSNVCFLESYVKNKTGRRSKIHIKIEKYLDEIGEKYESECSDQRFKKYNKITQTEYSPIPDIIIEDKKLVFEINGDKWHANPKIYKSTDIIERYSGPISAKDIRKFDKARKKQIESFGYKVVVLWECDINKKFEKIKKIINENCENN